MQQGIPRGRGRLTVVALGATLLTTACSSPSPELEYAVPSSLCGTKVTSTSLEPLLPPGKEISEEPTAAVGVERCRLQVDGKTVFSSSVEKRAADVSAQDVAESAVGVEPTDSATGDGRFIYSKTGAVGRVECPASGQSDASWWVTARTTDTVAAKDMLTFVKHYASAAAKTDACATR